MRMRRSVEFALAVRRGRRGAGRSLTVHLLTDDHDGAPRVGFVVGRNVGSAVVRNRVRRRLRHLMAARISALPAGSSTVVRAHPVAATMTSAELEAELDRALSRSSRGREAKAVT